MANVRTRHSEQRKRPTTAFGITREATIPDRVSCLGVDLAAGVLQTEHELCVPIRVSMLASQRQGSSRILKGRARAENGGEKKPGRRQHSQPCRSAEGHGSAACRSRGA
eukprot:3550630-Rhodomonas_salina.2